MQIKNVSDSEFSLYGEVVEGYDFTELLKTLEDKTEKPSDRVIYVPGDESLEKLPVAAEMRDNLFGGIPIQIGYCNGANRKLNCLEYHRGSETVIAADDIILLLAPKSKVKDNILDTKEVEAFLVKKGTGVLLYETSLHYAPCSAEEGGSFRVIVTLPLGTNTEKPDIKMKNQEDKLLTACNKWLIAHPDSDEAKQGAFIGLKGENITL